MKISGPYTRSTDGRQILIIKDGNKKTTMSYPKHLMEKQLGRKLKKYETIHHIDGDVGNNELENLKILNRSIHTKQHAKRRKPVIENCVWCGKSFELSTSQIGNYFRRVKEKKSGPFCSRSCSGTYGSAIQNKKIEKIERGKIKVEYYTIHEQMR